MLGFPSSDLAKQMSIRVHRMAHATVGQSESYFEKCVGYLKDNFAPEMFENYLDIACRNQHPVEEEGWAYVLWSSSAPDELFISASNGKLDEVARQLRVENPDNDPYGVLAAWLVHDPVQAYDDIDSHLAEHSLGGGFFDISLGDAKEALSNMLVSSDNHALSPWHVEEEYGHGYREEVSNDNEVELVRFGM